MATAGQQTTDWPGLFGAIIAAHSPGFLSSLQRLPDQGSAVERAGRLCGRKVDQGLEVRTDQLAQSPGDAGRFLGQMTEGVPCGVAAFSGIAAQVEHQCCQARQHRAQSSSWVETCRFHDPMRVPAGPGARLAYAHRTAKASGRRIGNGHRASRGPDTHSAQRFA